MKYTNDDTIVCKVYEFIGNMPACKLNTVVDNLKSEVVAENSIRWSISRLKKAKLVLCHKYNKDKNLFISTLKKPLSEVNQIINQSIVFKRKEKHHGY